MKEVTYWIAEDGTEFEDKCECEQYERQMILKEHKNDFVFYNDKDMISTTSADLGSELLKLNGNFDIVCVHF